jgi:protein-tyrosine phosphatase
MRFVTPWLAVGDALQTARDVDAVLRRGITHILNCRVGFDDRTLIGNRVGYLWDPAPDDRLPKEARWFLEAIEFVRDARRDPAARVLVHCTGGIDRSPSLAYAILRSAGWSPAGAELAIVDAHPGARLIYREDAERAVLRSLRSTVGMIGGHGLSTRGCGT